MGDTPLQSQIEAAQAYEALFVPALFGQWADRVVDLAHIQSGQRVLDVASGTGILARTAATRVGASGRVTGIDPNPGMVAVARQLASSVEWRVGTAESLDFPDESFDAVVSQFGLVFCTDRTRALREMQRVLAPGGHLVVAVWDALENIPAYAAEVELLAQTAGDAAAQALRAPFVLGHKADLTSLFKAAGVAPIEITTYSGTARFPSIRTLVEADLRGWLPVMGVNLAEDQIDPILREAEHTLSAYATPAGQVTFQLSAHVITARKP